MRAARRKQSNKDGGMHPGRCYVGGAFRMMRFWAMSFSIWSMRALMSI